MKKQMLSLITGAVLLLCCGGLPVAAQDIVRVQIPFDFQVNGQLLKAGDYVIKRDSQEPKRLYIQSSGRKVLVTVYTLPHSLSKSPARTSLLFRSYGDQHFLAEVRVEGNENGYAIIKSKAERKLARMTKENGVRAIPNSATTNN